MTIEEIEQQHSGVAYVVTRNVTREECPWLSSDLAEGDLIWPYTGYTYGVLSSSGVAATVEPGKTPFFEVPVDAVRMVGVD